MRGRSIVRGIFVLAVVLVWGLPSASAAEPLAGEFVALTYNVAGLPQGISGGDPTTNSPLISPLLNAYDLVLLQEDWADPVEAVPLLFFHHQIVSEANHPYRSEPAPPPLGTDLRRFPTGPPLIADGLNRLSRFPFEPIERVMWNACYGEFSISAVETILDAFGLVGPVEDLGLGDAVDGGAADCGAQKGFSVARTRLAEGIEIDVYNLHADASGGPADNAARAANFVQLADFVHEHSPGRAVIIGGDTNLHTDAGPDNAEDRRVWEGFQAASGVSDVCRVVECGADAGVIDKIAFRNGGGVELMPLTHRFERERFTRADGEPLSDHDPLAVRFAWETAGSTVGATPALPLTGGPGHAQIVAVVLILAGLIGRHRSRSVV